MDSPAGDFEAAMAWLTDCSRAVYDVALLCESRSMRRGSDLFCLLFFFVPFPTLLLPTFLSRATLSDHLMNLKETDSQMPS
jgi:hypothetical protein